MHPTLTESGTSELHANNTAGTEPVRVLFVQSEADESLLRGLEEQLAGARRIKARVARADGIPGALKYLSEEGADAILLDLSRASSLELAGRGADAVKAFAANAGRVPVIVLGGVDDDDLAGKLLQSGAVEYLSREEIGSSRLLERSIIYALERKSADEALGRSERSYEELINSLDSIVWEGDARTFQFTFVSEQAERLLGYPAERWVREPTFWQDHMHPEDRDWAVSFCAIATAEQRAHEFEYRMIAADGRAVWLRDIVAVIVENGRPVKLRGVMVDVTERKLAEEAMRVSEERFRAWFEQSPTPTRILSHDGQTLKANPALAKLLGITPEQATQYNLLEDEQLIRSGHMPYIMKTFSGEIVDLPVVQYSTNGCKSWLKSFAYPIKDAKGAVREVVLTTEDITEQKDAEDKIRQKEQQYQKVFEATTDGLVINDLEGHVVEVNPAFYEMHGYTHDEMVGIDPRKFVHQDSHEQLEQFFATVRAGKQFSTRAMDVRKDGSVFHVDVQGTSFMYNGEPHILGLVRDITEQVQAYELLEQRVEERTRELSTLLEISNNVASTLELGPLLNKILEQLRFVAAYSRAAILVVDGDELIMLDSRRDMAREKEPPQQRFPLTQSGPIWQTLKDQGSVTIPDIYASDALAGSYRNAVSALLEQGTHTRSWLGVPLLLKDRIIGLLSLSHDEQGYYSARHAKLAMAVANQAAVAIENARLYEQAQENTRKTAALSQIASQVALGGSLRTILDTLCQHVVDETGAAAAAIVLRDLEAEHDRMAGEYNLPDGYADAMNTLLASGVQMIMQEAFTGRRPMFLRDMRRSIGQSPEYAPLHPLIKDVSWDTVVAVPMVYRNSAVGVLLSYHPPTQNIGEAEMTFHGVIANQAAVAVENARLVAQAQDKARLEERQRLARDLHDSVTQGLFSINLIARSAELMMEREGTQTVQTMEKMSNLRQLTQGALAEMRALIFELRPGALEEEGLFEALRKHAAGMQGREMLQIDVASADKQAIPRLKPVAEEALYRIAQEALHNVAKHAKATAVRVSVEAEEGFLTLRVVDDGMGFDQGKVPAGHMGLGTMRQRAEALGGEYVVESVPGEGTTITVRVPLEEWEMPL